MYTRHPSVAFARLIPDAGAFSFESSYDRGLVDELKRRIPVTDRKWDAAKRRWLISPGYAPVCVALAEEYLAVTVNVPLLQASVRVETRLLKLEYLGRTKQREDGEASAFGWVNGSWSVIIPENILREWFSAVPQRPDEKPTLFAVLAIKQTATADDVRTAYRRLVRQWHPDVCHEPSAANVFKAIQHAYEVLSNEGLRRKYVAGLQLEASLKQQRQLPSYMAPADFGYRSPLRCGWLLCEGQQVLGRFAISKLIQWEDVIDARGRTMVSSWPAGADKFEVAWQ